MTRQSLLASIARIVEEDSVAETDVLAECEEWNSLSVLAFIALADEKLMTAVSPKDIEKASTFGDLVALVEDKLEDN